jgi:AraC-like DNA-binding protein
MAEQKHLVVLLLTLYKHNHYMESIWILAVFYVTFGHRLLNMTIGDLTMPRQENYQTGQTQKKSKPYQETSSFCNYKYETFKPPVRITNAGISDWKSGARYELKNRAFFSLNMVTGGNAYFNQRDFCGVVEPGQVFLSHINCGQAFATGNKGFLRKRFVRMEGELVQAHLRASGLINKNVVTPINKRSLVQLFRNAYRVMRERRKGFVEKLSLIAHEMLIELSKSVVDDYPPKLSAGIDYVYRNLHRSITLDEICRAMHVSVRQCTRLFQDNLKQSPLHFVHNQKHAWAENLLKETQLSIKEISEILGYKDPMYFSNRFKKFADISPSAFRNTAKTV